MNWLNYLFVPLTAALLCACERTNNTPDPCSNKVCPVGATCTNGICTDPIPGRYFVIGTTYSQYPASPPHSPLEIRDTVELIRSGDSAFSIISTLIAPDTLYFNSPSASTPAFDFILSTYGPGQYFDRKLQFKQAFDDSIFYYSKKGGLSWYETISFKGNKIR